MVNPLKRKTFYLHEDQASLLTDHIYRVYKQSGRRVTESEIIREALGLYFSTQAKGQDETASPGPEES